jgi:hypothetical protein
MKKLLLLFGALALFVLFPLNVSPTLAHPPTQMTLSYNYDNQVLTVTVFHSVTDPNTHYIELITINKNGAFAMNRTYTSQTSTSSMVDTFDVDAEDNDILQVTAICSISGQIQRQVTVSSGGLQTQPPPAIPGFPLVAISLGFIFAVGLALFRRRRLRKTN